MPDDTNCLICLAAAPDSTDVVKCEHKHPMHVDCLVRMIDHMGRWTCPYCSGRIPSAPTPRPSRRENLLALLEHMFCALVLTLTYVFSEKQRDLFHVNVDILRLRLRHSDVRRIKGAIGKFRTMVVQSALSLLPTIILVHRLVFSAEPWGRRELWEVAGCLSLLTH